MSVYKNSNQFANKNQFANSNQFESKNQFSNSNPYQKNNQNGNQNSNQNFEKKEDEKGLKIAFSRAFEDVVSSSENGMIFERIGFDESSEITDFYIKYYKKKVKIDFFLIASVASVASFYTIYSSFFILFSFLLLFTHSEKSFFKKYTKNIKVSQNFKKIIFEKLFFSEIDVKKSFFLVSFFIFSSLIISQFPFKIELLAETDFINFLKEKINLNIDFFLFALINFLANFSLIFIVPKQENVKN